MPGRQILAMTVALLTPLPTWAHFLQPGEVRTLVGDVQIETVSGDIVIALDIEPPDGRVDYRFVLQDAEGSVSFSGRGILVATGNQVRLSDPDGAFAFLFILHGTEQTLRGQATEMTVMQGSGLWQGNRFATPVSTEAAVSIDFHRRDPLSCKSISPHGACMIECKDGTPTHSQLSCIPNMSACCYCRPGPYLRSEGRCIADE